MSNVVYQNITVTYQIIYARMKQKRTARSTFRRNATLRIYFISRVFHIGSIIVRVGTNISMQNRSVLFLKPCLRSKVFVYGRVSRFLERKNSTRKPRHRPNKILRNDISTSTFYTMECNCSRLLIITIQHIPLLTFSVRRK